MKVRMKQGFTLIELLVVITIIAILASLSVPVFGRIQERGNMTKGISNAKQIITTLRLYSGDSSGNYPDAAGQGKPASTTANDAFRKLFIGGQATDEKIFGCPASANGNPDGNVGTESSDYAEAVGDGENHWAMTSGLNDSASGSVPVVYESPKTATFSNPQWDTAAAGSNKKGRTWSGRKVIIGMNDSSVAPIACDTNGRLQKQGSGQNAFEVAAPGGYTLLDIKTGTSNAAP